MTTQDFLDRYWQKKPLLMRQALIDFETPISPDELAGMSLEEGTAPRIIRFDDRGNYTLEHGPFAADRYDDIGERDWSLMITDCEKHWPELRQWIEPFRFLPRWRMDDLMISFAPDGASVGAHIDEYDVFLLQASGTRRWHIDKSDDPDTRIVKNAALRILQNFNATDTWVLQPGDVLYLPPGVPHHGVAIGNDCTTWSIGFRAPSNLDVLDMFSETLLETLPLQRFKDPALSVACGAEITPEALSQLRDLWNAATTLSDEELMRLSGRLLTRGGTGAEDDAHSSADSDTETDVDSAADKQAVSDWHGKSLSWHSFAEVAYALHEDSAELFVNGEAYRCSQALAKALGDHLQALPLPDALRDSDAQVLSELLEINALSVTDDSEFF